MIIVFFCVIINHIFTTYIILKSTFGIL